MGRRAVGFVQGRRGIGSYFNTQAGGDGDARWRSWQQKWVKKN